MGEPLMAVSYADMRVRRSAGVLAVIGAIVYYLAE